MPVRIRKTFTLFPGVRVNLSKGGMSVSVGKKGFTLNFSKHGVRQTTGLPGSGISYTTYLSRNDDDEKEKKDEKEERSASAEEKPIRQKRRRSVKEQVSSPWGFFFFVFVALFFIYFGASAFGLVPPNLLTNFLQTLTQWARQVGL